MGNSCLSEVAKTSILKTAAPRPDIAFLSIGYRPRSSELSRSDLVLLFFFFFFSFFERRPLFGFQATPVVHVCTDEDDPFRRC